MNHQSLRLTPSNSPFFKTSTPRSPTKTKNEEPGLRLRRVIGTTTASANGFDCLPSARQFAYTAGAAAVVATVEEDLKVSQRFFRARPAGARDTSNAGWPISPTPNDPRTRVLGTLREQNLNGSPLGSSGRDWSDSPSGKSATAKDRVKAATSVALSPNGKWIAVGETGYKPRVLIFSNKGEGTEAPVVALSEHTFGVHALSFSPDSRYLASLGTVNDGFLYLWSIDDRTGAATLHSSNKCTSMINAMTWVGRSVLTVGLRFVKLWRPDDDLAADNRLVEVTNLTPRQKASDFGNSILSPKHKVLQGKNCLLGDLLDANFVSALAIPDTGRAVLCAESGEICVLDDTDKAQTLIAIAVVSFKITAARLDDNEKLLHVSGPNSQTKTFGLLDLFKRSPASVKRERRSTMSPFKNSSLDATATAVTGCIGDIIVEIDSRKGIRLTKSSLHPEDNDSRKGIRLTKSSLHPEDNEAEFQQLPAHNDAVLGVQCFTSQSSPNAAFLTFAGDGSIKIWDTEGEAITNLQAPVESNPTMFDLNNELRAVASLETGSALASGDKYGTLSILDSSSGAVTAQVRAHSTEVVDIIAFKRANTQLIATASRDRTVQLFAYQEKTLELLQTMDEHAAAISGLLVAHNGEFLLSCSADRTVVVREAMLRVEDNPKSLAFIILRTITLKSSPTSMCLGADDDELLISTVDRCVGKYSIKNGQAGFNFKCYDVEGGEATAMAKILYTPSLNGNPTIVGVSSTDKSVRLYSEYGMLIARDWGHTEGITDVALVLAGQPRGRVQDLRAQLVTVAADSTIFMWDTIAHAPVVNAQESDVNGLNDTPTATKLTPMAPPLRKVLSYSELARTKREKSIDEGEATSPPTVSTPTFQQPPSPKRLNRKTSRVSVAQPPRLEPAFRSSFADTKRRKRSPSPPSPRGNSKKDLNRRPSLGMTLRSKSSENVLSTLTSGSNSSSSFGSVTASTESVCRTLRSYRKRLVNSSTSDKIAPETLRELEKELKLTARVVGEKSQGKTIDEATLARLLDQASEKIVSRLDERIKERVESEVRRSSEGSPSNVSAVQSPIELVDQSKQMDAVAGALEKVSIDDGGTE